MKQSTKKKDQEYIDDEPNAAADFKPTTSAKPTAANTAEPIAVAAASLPIVITYKCDCNLILCIRVQFTTKTELAKFFSPSLVV